MKIHYVLLPGYPWATPVALIVRTIFVGMILTTSNSIQEYRNKLAPMASSSEEFHLTPSGYKDTHRRAHKKG